MWKKRFHHRYIQEAREKSIMIAALFHRCAKNGLKIFARRKSNPLLSRGLRWNSAGALVNQASGLLLIFLAAYYEGKEALGAFGLIQNTITALSSVLTAAGILTSTKFVSEFKHTDKVRAGRYLAIPLFLLSVIGFLLSLLLYFANDAIAIQILKVPSMSHLLGISGPWLFLSIFNAQQTGNMLGLELFKGAAISNFCFAAGRLALTFLSLHFGHGIEGMIIALTGALAVQTLAQSCMIRNGMKSLSIKPTLSGWQSETRKILQFSLPAVMSSFVIGSAVWVCNVLVVRTEAGLADMALITICLQWQMAVRFVPTRLLEASLPILSSLHGQNEGKEFWSVFKYTVTKIIMDSVLIAGVLIVSSPALLPLYGFNGSRPVLIFSIFLIGTVLHMTNRALVQVYLARGETLKDLYLSLTRSLLLLISFYFLKVYGATGLAISIVASYAVSSVLLIINNYKLANEKITVG